MYVIFFKEFLIKKYFYVVYVHVYRLVMNDYLPQTSFQVSGPTRDVVALRHQFPYQHRFVYKEIYFKLFKSIFLFKY